MPKFLTEEEVSDFRSLLCKTALNQFVEKGYEHVTMRSIADEIGCSRMKPYRYFKDKSEILAAVKAESFRAINELIEKELNKKNKDVSQRMRHISKNYFDFALENGSLYSLMFSEPSSFFKDESEELEEEKARLQKNFKAVSKLAVEAGIVKCDPGYASQMLWAAMHGAVSLYLSNSLSLNKSFDKFSKDIVMATFKGLAE